MCCFMAEKHISIVPNKIDRFWVIYNTNLLPGRLPDNLLVFLPLKYLAGHNLHALAGIKNNFKIIRIKQKQNWLKNQAPKHWLNELWVGLKTICNTLLRAIQGRPLKM